MKQNRRLADYRRHVTEEAVAAYGPVPDVDPAKLAPAQYGKGRVAAKARKSS
jgi:hypothetical protein